MSVAATIQAAEPPVVRRSPFSENPVVGARGQLTRQRILDAAIDVFGEVGYHRASIDEVARRSGCSRASFYQYFAGKEDLFRHLAAGVAAQVRAITDALGPLTPDAEGWSAIRSWLARYEEFHARYRPVFVAYETDLTLAAVAAHTGDDVITRIHARLVAPTLPPRRVDAVIRLLLECLNHAFGVVGVLRGAAPEDYPGERVPDAFADVVHRTFFGRRPGVNERPPGPPPQPLDFSDPMRLMLRSDGGERPGAGPEAADGSVRAALLEAGRELFAVRGYGETRVDDLVAAAGVSRSAFYRHFANKGELVRALAVQGMRKASIPLGGLPELSALHRPGGPLVLRRWLRRYHAEHLREATSLLSWREAALEDPQLRSEYAPPLDWGRRHLAAHLRGGAVGDVEMEAVLMVALLGVFGARPRRPSELEAAVHVIDGGVLGH